eukprot:UN25031
MLNLCKITKNVNLAINLWKLCFEKRLVPDYHIVDSVMEVCCLSKRYDLIDHIYSTMLKYNIEPSTQTYKMVAEALGNKNEGTPTSPETITNLIQEMVKFGLVVDSKVFNGFFKC